MSDVAKQGRRKLSSLRRASGNILEMSVNQFGRRVTTYDGIPIEVDDNIPDNQTKGTSTDCSSIYALQFGFETGVCGLQPGLGQRAGRHGVFLSGHQRPQAR